MVSYVLKAAALAFAAVAQPGPFQAYLLARSTRNGWRRTLPAALAPLISDGPIIRLVLFVLTRIPPWLEQALLLAGGVFAFYLAYGAYRDLQAVADMEARSGQESATRHGILNAALANLFSPGPWVFWSVLAGPIFVAGWKQDVVSGISFLVGFYGVLIAGFAAQIVAFSLIGHRNPKIQRILGHLSVGTLIVLGTVEIIQGVGVDLTALAG
ncbi:MAG: LysE family transporter [Anaerolineae bacterium]|nr:LysE family transporter [Anaerolineae bacterium]